MPVKKLKKTIVKKVAVKNVATKSKFTVKDRAEISVKSESVLDRKVVVSIPKKSAGLNASVFDIKGKIAGRVNLPSEIFNAKINNVLMSQAVRVYLANQRQGTAKTKNRGEINATTKKVWQQKGTGRARHGSKRAPIFVGGGVTFGQNPRDLSLNISKKMKILALFSALSSKLKNQELKIVKGLETLMPKTKLMEEVLRNLGKDKNSKVLLIIPKAGKETENVYRAGRNIEGVEILSANSLNTYKVLDNTLVLLMKDSVGSLRDTFVKH